MGLEKDIFDAIVETVGGDASELSSLQTKSLKKFSGRMSEAIVDFIVNNTWTVSKLKAHVQVEEIKTSGPYNGKVKTQSTTLAGQPVVVAGSGGSTTGPGKATGDGVITEKMHMRVDGMGKHGGNLTAIGHAWIGPEDPYEQSDTKEPQNEFTEVKLFRDNIDRDTL